MYCYYALRAYSLESSLGSGKRKQDSDVRSGLRFLRLEHSLVSAGIRIEHSQIQPSSLIKSGCLGHKWFFLLKTTFSWSFAHLIQARRVCAKAKQRSVVPSDKDDLLRARLILLFRFSSEGLFSFFLLCSYRLTPATSTHPPPNSYTISCGGLG